MNEDNDNNHFYHLDYKIYLSMMLIFIKLKFGKYNPSFLFCYILNNIKGNSSLIIKNLERRTIIDVEHILIMKIKMIFLIIIYF